VTQKPRNGSIHVEPLVLFEDEPVSSHSIDELQLRPFSEVIAGTALGTKGPFTIGVFADWGQGKTSVLRQAESLVKASAAGADTICVRFNAWQFERDEHPIVPLVATIVDGIDRELEQRQADLAEQPARQKAMQNVARALRSVAYGFSARAKVNVGLAEVEAGFVAKEMIDRYDRLRVGGDPLLDRSLYYDAFERLAAAADAPDHPKIVVFIDDLDRCMPDTGLALLESLKLILAQPGFIFVLAVDRRVIEGYLRKRYQQDFGVEDYDADGTSYLDKIVQLPLGLPPHRARFEAYVEGLLKRQTFLASNSEVAEALGGMTSLLAAGSAHNPRSLVRFINNLIVDRRIRAESGLAIESEDLKLCAVSRILRQQLQDSLYRALVRNNDWCETLADAGLSQGPTAEAHPVLAKIVDRLGRIETSAELLEIDAVRIWLTEHDRRVAVDGFLVSERQVERDDDLVGSAHGGLFGTVSQATLTDTEALVAEAERQTGLWEPTDVSREPKEFRGFFLYMIRPFGEIEFSVTFGSILQGDRWDNDRVPRMALVHGAAKDVRPFVSLSVLTYLGLEWDEGYLSLSKHLLASVTIPEGFERVEHS
jgi:hypothetical protein